MPRTQPFNHPIETSNSVLPSFTFVLLLMMLAAIVLLGILGDDDGENEVRANQTVEEAADPSESKSAVVDSESKKLDPKAAGTETFDPTDN